MHSESNLMTASQLIIFLEECIKRYGDCPVLTSIRTESNKVYMSNVVDFAHVAVGGNNFDTGEPELDMSIVLKNSFAPLNSEGDDIRFCVEIRDNQEGDNQEGDNNE